MSFIKKLFKNNYRPSIILTWLPRKKKFILKMYTSYESRSLSTSKLILESITGLILESRRKINFNFYCDDQPPNSLFNGNFPKLTKEYKLAYTKSNNDAGIELIPDFIFWDWPEVGIPSYIDLTSDLIYLSKNKPIYNKLFWIGNISTHKNREILFNKREENDLYDFRNTQWRRQSEDSNKLYSENFISLSDHSKFKYLLDVEGNGYSGRLKILLHSGRPLFIQDRPYHEYYFQYLKEFIHYIPVKRDFSDLNEKIIWSEQNPDKCRIIAQNALSFAEQHLSRKAAISYIRRLISSIGSNKFIYRRNR